MLTTVRAGIAILMLLGFSVFACAIVGGLAWLSILVFTTGHGGVLGAKLGYLAIGAGTGILVVLWRVARARPPYPSGLPIDPQRAPALWAVVDELAARMKTRRPDTIVLVPEVNASVSERGRLLGLLGGRRVMTIGAPLLQGFTVAQLRSVLAHEFGHYSRRDTRLGPIAYRGRAAVVGTVQQLSGPLAGLFGIYARLYLMVEAAFDRRQEFHADVASVQVAGRGIAQSALRELPAIEAAWKFYVATYLEPGWHAGYAPSDIFGGFGALLRTRRAELAEIRQAPLPSKQSSWDSHPPLAARIQAMERMVDVPAPVDQRPATGLLPDFDQACLALAASVFPLGSRQVVSWDEFTVRGVIANRQAAADETLRAVARLTGGTPSLATVLDLSAAGRLGEVGGPLKEDPRGAIGVLVAVAAVNSGAASWRHSWSGPAELVRADGRELAVDEIAALAANAQTVESARRRLLCAGIDPDRAALVQLAATAKGARIVGGIANVKANDRHHDVLILHNGLILAAGPSSSDNGRRRLLELANSGSMEELARRHAFLPFENIVSVTVVRTVPLKLEVGLHSGAKLLLHVTLTGDTLTPASTEDLVKGLMSRLTVDRPATSTP